MKKTLWNKLLTVIVSMTIFLTTSLGMGITAQAASHSVFAMEEGAIVSGGDTIGFSSNPAGWDIIEVSFFTGLPLGENTWIQNEGDAWIQQSSGSVMVPSGQWELYAIMEDDIEGVFTLCFVDMAEEETSSKSSSKSTPGCSHDLEWVTTSPATADSDGSI